MNDEVQPRIQVVVAGDASVGKTSVILNFAKGMSASLNQSRPTVGVDYWSVPCDINETHYILQIADTAGQERFRAFATSYFRRCDAILVFYSIESRRSFDNVRYWKKTADENKLNDAVVMLIVGNKSDLEDVREVQTAEGKSLARALGCSFIETSAVTGDGVHEAFEMITRLVVETKPPTVMQGTKAIKLNLATADWRNGAGCCGK
jgi:small GTP-binding protein